MGAAAALWPARLSRHPQRAAPSSSTSPLPRRFLFASASSSCSRSGRTEHNRGDDGKTTTGQTEGMPLRSRGTDGGMHRMALRWLWAARRRRGHVRQHELVRLPQRRLPAQLCLPGILDALPQLPAPARRGRGRRGETESLRTHKISAVHQRVEPRGQLIVSTADALYSLILASVRPPLKRLPCRTTQQEMRAL